MLKAKLFIFLFTAVTSLIIFAGLTFAAVTATISPKEPDENTPSVSVTFTGLQPNHEYKVKAKDTTNEKNIKSDDAGKNSTTVCGDDIGGALTLKWDNCGANDYFHGSKTYNVYLYDGGTKVATAQFTVKHFYPEVAVSSPGDKPKPGEQIDITICGKRRPTNDSGRNTIDFDLIYPDGKNHDNVIKDSSGKSSSKLNLTENAGCSFAHFTAPEEGNYKLLVKWDDDNFALYQFDITVDPKGGSIEKFKDPNGKEGGTAKGQVGKNPCDQANTGTGECKTALGTISTDPDVFVNRILSIGIGLGGGIAFILMVIGSIRVLTSSGDQQKLSGGRDMIVAAISGLLFLIFSVLILRFIGIEILGLK